jgi:GNAT superfamily N-acetyltransferase
MIDYRDDLRPDLDAAIELYRSSTLGERRPIDDRVRFAQMMQHANLIITAWQGTVLIGISRCITDFAWTTYLADLAVRASHQRQGIGKELIRRTQAAAPQAKLLLLAAPAAEKYYPHVGFRHFPQAWILRENETLVNAKLIGAGATA